jgi:SAM-dependent methyltransferase
MIRWPSGETVQTRCKVCCAEGTMALCAAAPHIARPENEVLFSQCSTCASISALEDITDFDQIQEGDADIFLRQYVESTAGLWEMFWPPASLQDAATKSFLDVGCGYGFTADAWKTVLHPHAFGCDPARYASAGRQTLGEHIHHALLDDVSSLLGARFDVVYSSEVIEHVPDPRGFVRMLEARLNPSGTLVLTTPAADFIRPGNDPATTMAALAPGFHGFLFSRDAMESLLRASGFAHVTVERHNERLIAWASHAPILRRSVDANLANLYARYQSLKIETLRDCTDERQQSLLVGFAYRLFKDRMLRGNTEGLAELRQLLLAHMVPGHDLNQENPTELAQHFTNLDAGATAFGTLARYCFPQLALLMGFYADSLERRQDKAYAWFELALTSTQKLCGPTVISGLEAAAFYWQAMQRLTALDLANGRPAQAIERLLTCMEALAHPEPLIGGGSPSAPAVWGLLDGLVNALLQQRHSQALTQLSQAFAAAKPTHAEHADAEAFATMGALTSQYMQLAAHITQLNGAAARAVLAQLRQPASHPHHAAVQWHQLLQQRLPALATRLPTDAPPGGAGGVSFKIPSVVGQWGRR